MQLPLCTMWFASLVLINFYVTLKRVRKTLYSLIQQQSSNNS